MTNHNLDIYLQKLKQSANALNWIWTEDNFITKWATTPPPQFLTISTAYLVQYFHILCPPNFFGIYDDLTSEHAPGLQKYDLE